jgi:hypothetical protein
VGTLHREDSTVTRPFDEHRDSALWRAVAQIVTELVATREITINTAPDYVIGYFCRELTAKGMVSSRASEVR